QLKVISTALVRNRLGQDVATRSLQALLSRKTLGVPLPPSAPASAALTLQNAPNVQGSLLVHWGPVACYDAVNPWTLSGSMDTNRFPRKFALGAIQGSVPTLLSPTYPRSPTDAPPASDQKEYWAFSTLGSLPVMDDAFYTTAAASSGNE